MSGDALSSVEIGRRQQELEREIQGLPQAQRDADESVVNAELAFKRAEAVKLHDLATNSTRKLTVAERDAEVFQTCEKQWLVFQTAKVAAEYNKNRSKAVYAELTSLASRMKAANEANNAHARWGQG